jgi:hypothetical protein
MGFMNAHRPIVTASGSPHARRVLLAAVAALALACATGLAGTAQAAEPSCAKLEEPKRKQEEQLRAEARSTQLPQCRVYEMVSPVDTADSGVPGYTGAAPGGEAAKFLSVGGFAGAGSNYGFNWYVARRGSEGWGTSWIGVPAALGGTAVGTTTSFDLTKQVMRLQFLTGEKAGSTGLLLSENLAAAPALSFGELSEYENIPHQLTGNEGISELEDESPDLAHLVVPSNISESFREPKLYELSGAGTPAEALQLVSIDPEGKPIDAAVGSGAGRGGSIFHAISNDGAEIFFSKYERRVTGPSYVRVNGETTSPTTLELGGGLFQGASEDGSKVFLRDAGYKLYMDEIGREPGHVEVTKTVPISGESLGLYVRSSDDGSHVYFVSNGVLAANENENKETASATAWNLYVYDTLTEKTAFIAQAEPGGELFANILPGIHVEAQVNGCPSKELGEPEEPGCEAGRFFVFTSAAHITPGDTASAKQVFEYDAKTGRLARVSTGEGGYAGNGNNNALGASIAAPEFGAPGFEKQQELFEDGTRAVSDDGSTVVFSSSGALSPRAVNDLQPQPGPVDVYESHDGQVSLLSTGHSLTSDEQPAITPSGRDVFFLSTENILPQDSDGLMSLYDARVGGGFPAALVPAGGCNGDACQGPPSVPDLLGAPASATFSGLGNPVPAAPTPAVKSKAKSKLKECRRGFVRKRGRCVKRPKAKKAGNDRRIKR